jgi:hypothetical protein
MLRELAELTGLSARVTARRWSGAFLDHLEHERGNSARSRNTRLAAIHSLFRFAALRHPEHAALDRPSTSPPTQALRPCCRVLPQRQADLGPEFSCGFLSVPERFRPLP